jgi:hypothetical protein
VLDHSRDLIGAHHHHNVRAVRRLRVDDKGFGSNLHTLKTRCLERLTKLLLRVEGHLRVVRQVRGGGGIARLRCRRGCLLGEGRVGKQYD